MERISYEEAKEWFWIRTWLWTAVAAILTVMAWFAFSNGVVEAFAPRMWVSLGSGIGSVLLGLLAAGISLQFVWMRRGWRFSFLPNGPASAGVATLAAFLICGTILTFMQNDPYHRPSAALIDRTYNLMRFGIGASAFWGFVYGSWFAMRRDKYFVEPI